MKERQEAIRRFIEARGEARIEELQAAFPDWSAMTIRRDLEFLEKGRFLFRTKGGARALPTGYGVSEDVYGERETRNFVQKQEIGGKAAALAEADRGIFIDAGTTAMALARQLPDYHLAVITAAPNVALEILLKKSRPTVILLGGTVSRKSISTSGPDVQEQLRNLNIDTAFMSTSGFTRAAGFSVGDPHECELKRQIIAKARRVVMLFDSSKFGAEMPFTFARPQDIGILVGDAALPVSLRGYFTEQGVQIL